MAKIYVASSWRNVFQQDVVDILRDLGHEVYDFKNPPHGNGGFQWSDIDPDWQNWTTEQYREALNHRAEPECPCLVSYAIQNSFKAP